MMPRDEYVQKLKTQLDQRSARRQLRSPNIRVFE